MMRLRCGSCLLALGLVSLAAAPAGPSAVATQADALSSGLEPLRPFLGSWVGEFQDADERPRVLRSWTPILDGQALREIRTVPEFEFEAETIYYLDRAAGMIAYLGMTDNGYVSRGRVEYDGDEYVQSGEQTRPDSTTQAIRVTFRFLEDGRLLNQLHNLEDGGWRPGHTIIYTRDGGPL